MTHAGLGEVGAWEETKPGVPVAVSSVTGATVAG